MKLRTTDRSSTTSLRRRLLAITTLAAATAAAATPAMSADWPRWRGPHLDGISREKGLRTDWGDDEPEALWRAKVGTGFSAVSVAGGKVYTAGNASNTDTVYCFDAATGKEVWTHSYPAPLDPNLFEGGPTATPAVDGGSVYVLGRRGQLFRLGAADGSVAWSTNVQKRTKAGIPGWGFSGSPLVHGELLLLNVGGAGMAVRIKDGSTAWFSDKAEAGFSTPVVYSHGGRDLALFSSGKAFTAADPTTGKTAWSHRWVTRYGINAADAVVGDGHVFLSSGYEKGATALKLGSGAGSPEEAWRSKVMRNQMNPSVLIGGHLYGCDGNDNPRVPLKCVELLTGKERWSFPRVGSGSVTAADGHLIVLSAKGELMIAPASPEGFEPVLRAQVLGGRCWTVPVLANGRLYCRNARGDLVCLDVARPSA